MKFAYTRGGAPLLDWKNGPPRQSRAADSVALGSVLDGSTLDNMPLPRPGSPEPLDGCSCSGSCGCGTPAVPALGDVAGIVGSIPIIGSSLIEPDTSQPPLPAVAGQTTPMYPAKVSMLGWAAIGLAAYLGYKHFKKPKPA
jgi:hypothetical protein